MKQRFCYFQREFLSDILKVNMEENSKKFGIQDNYDFNILLLGETGVGKSTFINSIANYLLHHDLNEAMANDFLYLIPCMFNITDDNYRPQRVTVGKDDNEYQLVGDSATQDVRTYVFPIGSGKTRLRLIDTPGMGDPRGVDQDDANCENILTHIGQYHLLHAICLLFRPNDARVTITFEYCVKQILSRLDKSAAKNIIFIFTNSKATHFKPGETWACLKRLVKDIKEQPPHVDIKVEDNVFCFDNEAFRFLAAKKQGIEFEDTTKEEYAKSWENSSKEGWKLIKFIIGDEGRDPLTPHMVKSSKSVNEVRRVLNNLAQPLADISQLILDNLNILDRRQKLLQEHNFSLDKLKEKLYVPVINLEVIKLTQPATVCCDAKCAEWISIDGRTTWNYKQRCHDPCHLDNVHEEIIGAPELAYCAAIDRATQTCKKCRCSMYVHMHIYYMTRKFDDKQIDQNVKEKITTTEKALAKAERLIKKITKRKTELENEKNNIVSYAAKFASFLHNSAITPFNDAYRKYINYMIIREQSLGNRADLKTIQHFEDLLVKYDQVKMTFERVMDSNDEFENSKKIEPQDIKEMLQKLFTLKHNGRKIKELYYSRNIPRKKEHQQSEYVHQLPVNQPSSNMKQTFIQDPKNVTTNVVSDPESWEKQKKTEINEIVARPREESSEKSHTKMFFVKDQNKKPLVFDKRQQPRSSNEARTHRNLPPVDHLSPFKFSPSDHRSPQNNNLRFDNQALSVHGPLPDNRPPYDNRPPNYSRPPVDNRRPNYSRPPVDNRPPNFTESPMDDRPSYNNRPPYDSRPSHYNRPPYDTRPPYDNRPPYDSRPPDDNHPPYDNRPTHDNRLSYDSRPSQDNRPHDNRPTHDNRVSYDSRSSQGNRSSYDNRPQYDSRLPYDTGSRFDQRLCYDNRSHYNSRNDRRPAARSSRNLEKTCLSLDDLLNFRHRSDNKNPSQVARGVQSVPPPRFRRLSHKEK